MARAVAWTGLLFGLAVPFVVALGAFGNLPDRCTEELRWTFAPLLFTCGPRSLGIVALGWIGTFVAVGGLVAAIIASTIGLVMSLKRTDSTGRAASLHVALTTLLVWIVVLTVIAIQPDTLWGTNSWVFFASATGLVVWVLSGATRAVVVIRRSPSPFDDNAIG